MSKDTFFVVQLGIREFRSDSLRGRLREMLGRDDSGREQTLFEKRRFWKRCSALILEALPQFDYGTWDLVRAGDADAQFETWCAEIEGSLASEPEELGAQPDEAHRLTSDARYLVVTMMALVGRGTNADETLGERCDLPEARWFTRHTFGQLVGTFPLLNFANVRADAIYVVPGGARDALAEHELLAGWSHLKPLTG
jgi:hypothetical protein